MERRWGVLAKSSYFSRSIFTASGVKDTLILPISSQDGVFVKDNKSQGTMPHPGDKIHIPLKTDEALRLALQVKPTKDMPRPGAAKKKAVPKKSRRARNRVVS
jgi:hypothetical protein